MSETDEGREVETAGKGGRRTRASMATTRSVGGGAVYGIGMIGALVYFLLSARSQPDYLLAVPKAVVWPALLVYKAFQRLEG